MQGRRSLQKRKALKSVIEEQRVQEDNLKLYMRIVNQHPTISFNKMDKDHHHRERILKTMSRFPHKGLKSNT
jgi:hypothetical protein